MPSISQPIRDDSTVAPDQHSLFGSGSRRPPGKKPYPRLDELPPQFSSPCREDVTVQRRRKHLQGVLKSKPNLNFMGKMPWRDKRARNRVLLVHNGVKWIDKLK